MTLRAAAAALCLIAGHHAAAAGEPVALELVLAVDASSSVDEREFELQRLGIAGALIDPAVIRAIESLAPGGVAITLVQWSGAGVHQQAVGWTRLGDALGAARLATRIAEMPRAVTGGATAIGDALVFALDLLEGNGFDGARRIIDISGDGSTNEGEHPAFVRKRVIDAGVTVNGLAILNDEPRLDFYYRSGVMGGPNAFVMTADDYADFARAIRLKLITEISDSPVAGLPSSRQQVAQAIPGGGQHQARQPQGRAAGKPAVADPGEDVEAFRRAGDRLRDQLAGEAGQRHALAGKALRVVDRAVEPADIR